jgi:hypothetical protein
MHEGVQPHLPLVDAILQTTLAKPFLRSPNGQFTLNDAVTKLSLDQSASSSEDFLSNPENIDETSASQPIQSPEEVRQEEEIVGVANALLDKALERRHTLRRQRNHSFSASLDKGSSRSPESVAEIVHLRSNSSPMRSPEQTAQIHSPSSADPMFLLHRPLPQLNCMQDSTGRSGT